PNVSTVIDGECTSISSLQDIREGDALIMFVFARYYKIDLKYLSLAKEKGAKIILVLNDITESLTEYADIVLTVSTENMSFFNSKIGVEVVAEYILVLIGRKVDYMERLIERDELTEDERL
nr:SIS domain-containing protein [Clostridia bacterium]